MNEVYYGQEVHRRSLQRFKQQPRYENYSLVLNSFIDPVVILRTVSKYPKGSVFKARKLAHLRPWMYEVTKEINGSKYGIESNYSLRTFKSFRTGDLGDCCICNDFYMVELRDVCNDQ